MSIKQNDKGTLSFPGFSDKTAEVEVVKVLPGKDHIWVYSEDTNEMLYVKYEQFTKEE